MKFTIIALSTALLSSGIYASEDLVGRVVKKQGKAELLVNPSDKVVGAGPHVLLNGKYYTSEEVKLGSKLSNGAILRTGKDAKLKIVYKNGDQMNVDEGTSYEVSWKPTETGKKEDPGSINLMYGSIRGVINKNGPRSGVAVKTKQAVMGIRGTDFHIGQQGTSGSSTLAVLRGKVEVADIKDSKKKIDVAQGFTAEIKKEEVKAASDSVGDKKETALFEVAKTSKQELVQIQKASEIKQDVKELKDAPVEIKQELAKLETKAVENTLSDIKQYDPALYENLKKKNIEDVDKINTVVVGKVFEQAPVKKMKPGIDDSELEKNAYEKYFKIE
jgi:hypothetical protein